MTDKSLDADTIIEKLSKLMQAPDPKDFGEAMEVANPEGDHKKEVWTKSVKKIKQVVEEPKTEEEKQKEADDILTEIRARRKASAKAYKTKVVRRVNGPKATVKVVDEKGEQEEWSDEVIKESYSEENEKIWRRYVLLKGIPIREDQQLWLRVKHEENEYYFDEVNQETIVVEFHEEKEHFPLHLEIELWYVDVPEKRFIRHGMFPNNPSVKRVSTDLSKRGLHIKGITDTQRSVKKWLQEVSTERLKQNRKDAEDSLHVPGAGGQITLSGGNAQGFSASASSWAPISSAIGIGSVIGNGSISVSGWDNNTLAIEPILNDDSDLTESMEEQVEKKIKTAVEELRDEIRDELWGELKKEIADELQTGKIALPLIEDHISPDFQQISTNTQIYSKYEMTEILEKLVKRQNDKDKGIISNQCFDIKNLELGSLISEVGVDEWIAEERIEKFLKKVITEDEDTDLGGLD